MALEIHEDVLYTILSKMPLKSLKRFTCLCYFMSMFRTNFLSKHHSHYDDDTSLFLQQNPHTALTLHQTLQSGFRDYQRASYLISGDKFENRIKLDWPPPIKEDHYYITILGSSIYGIFCLHQYGEIYNKFVLWNPTTEEFRIIPHSPPDSLFYPNLITTIWASGFGYDTIRDDFKVIRVLKFLPQMHCEQDDWRDELINIPLPSPCLEIYSLRSNSWRKFDNYFLHMSGHPYDYIYMNGACHWLVGYCGGKDFFFESFNLSNEAFFETPLPLDVLPSPWGPNKYLLEINGSIAVIFGFPDKTFHISILGELGVKESWTKLFIVGPLPSIGFPIGVSKKGDIIFRLERGELALFDFSKQELKEIVIEEKLSYHWMVIYKKSYLQIERTEY